MLIVPVYIAGSLPDRLGGGGEDPVTTISRLLVIPDTRGPYLGPQQPWFLLPTVLLTRAESVTSLRGTLCQWQSCLFFLLGRADAQLPGRGGGAVKGVGVS